MLQQTIEKLGELRLTAFIDELKTQIASPGAYQSLSFEERLALLVDREHIRRKNSALQRRLKTANIRADATIENIDFTIPRNLARADFMALTTMEWLVAGHNLAITGPTGLGKTFLAQALVDKACRLGYQALAIKCHDLLSQLLIARADGSYARFAARIAKLHLLFIDEWLRDPISPAQARELHDLFDLKYRNTSTLFVSQLAPGDWHAHIEDPTIADALLDRIVHNAYKLALDGPSVRKTQSTVGQKKHTKGKSQ